MSNLISPDHDFMTVVQLIESAKQRVSRAVNTELIDLYWAVGEYVSQKLSTDAWGKGTVEALADYIQRHQPGLRGFSAKNIWRMRQFYEAYRDTPILSTLLRELPWSAHLHVLTRSKYPEEREFYLRTAIQQQPHRRHPRVFLSEIQYKAQTYWIPAFTGMTAARLHA